MVSLKWQEEGKAKESDQVSNFTANVGDMCNLEDITSYYKPPLLSHVHLSNNGKVWRIFLYRFS